ncbi:MAG: phosphatase PAP2 family protein [Agathobacter sp.]
MTKECYLKMTQPFRDRPKLAKSLHIVNDVLTGIIFVSYPIFLIWLLWQKSPQLLKAILIPLDGFIVLTVFRAMINRKRPYEQFEREPVIPKDTRGKSFPSRHVFSAAVIAMTFFLQPQLVGIGVLFLGFSVILAVIRVVTGIHFISDVLGAFVFAAAAWSIGFYLF